MYRRQALPLHTVIRQRGVLRARHVFDLPKDAFDAFPKGETYIQAGPVVPISQAVDAPWPKESTHKFRLMRDPKAARDFAGGTFRLATIDEFPASKTMSGGLMVINK